jgi:hypothetical protein
VRRAGTPGRPVRAAGSRHARAPNRRRALRAAIAAAWLATSSPAARADAPGYDEALHALREGRAGDAAALLQELVRRMPAHAGAWLDLGLAFCELGRARDAEQVFAHIEASFSPGPAIREVIALYRASGCAPRALGAAPPLWEFRVGAGHAGNVNQGINDLTVLYGPAGQSVPLQLTDEFRPRGAAFASADAFHRRPLDAAGRWQWDSGLRLRNYAGISGYDTALLFTGLTRQWQAAGWRGDAQAGLSQFWLGGRSYQQGVGVGATAWLPLATGWAAGGEVDLFAYRYPSLSKYDNLQGAWQLKLRRFGAGWQLTGGVGWTRDLANERPGGHRGGPTASLRWQALPVEGLSLDLLLLWRRLDDAGPYNPLLWEGAVRSQRQRLAQFSVERRLGPRDALRLELNRTETDDALPIFAWSGTSVGLTWIHTLRER